jgi:hypothetical protein
LSPSLLQNDVIDLFSELAAICKRLDLNHPVMTVLSNPTHSTLDRVASLCPLIDAVGVNSYGGLKKWPQQLQASMLAYRNPDFTIGRDTKCYTPLRTPFFGFQALLRSI